MVKYPQRSPESQGSYERQTNMTRTIIVVSTLLAVLFCFQGCTRHGGSETNPKGEDSSELVEDSSELVEASSELIESLRQMAIQKVDEIKGDGYHLKYDITVREFPEKWVIYFNGKLQYPGNHCLVSKNKITGEVTFAMGQ